MSSILNKKINEHNGNKYLMWNLKICNDWNI